MKENTFSSLEPKWVFAIKSHFRKMHANTICDGFHKKESKINHTLMCNALLGVNTIWIYIPSKEDVYVENENEQLYIYLGYYKAT